MGEEGWGPYAGQPGCCRSFSVFFPFFLVLFSSPFSSQKWQNWCLASILSITIFSIKK